jgi:hypothetical protein
MNQVQEFTPAGALAQTLNDTNTSLGTGGSAFDAAGNFYVTDFHNQTVSKFDTTGTFVGHFGSGYNTDPESILFDKIGNAYVGQADGSHQILKFDSTGNPLASYSPATENRGTDWIDLASDQCTMHYTSEGHAVKSFNVCANTQNPDFATGLPGLYAFAHRILSDGGELVADTDRVVRLDSSGNVVQTYLLGDPNQLFALNLDPNGTSFWTAELNAPGQVFKVNIATGAIEEQWTGNAGGVAGLSVLGEITQGGPTPTPTPVVTSTPTPTPVVTPTPTPVGTSRIWGDVDCGGDIAPRDAQAILKNVLVQNPLSQTQPCPAIGSQVTVDGVSRIWGDEDCSGDITPRDAQAILKNVLVQNALSQTQPCPAVGSTVQVVG